MHEACALPGAFGKGSRELGWGRDVSFQWVSTYSVPKKLISQGARSEKFQLKG